MPANRAAPIVARVAFSDAAGASIAMDLDFRQEGPQHRDIVVETDAGTLKLANGGAVLSIAGAAAADGTALHGEYPGLYRRFVALVRTGVSDVDAVPLRLVADTFLRARISMVAPLPLVTRAGGAAARRT